MLRDLLNSKIYDNLDERVRKGLFCSFIAFIIEDNIVESIFEYDSETLLKMIGTYFNINFNKVELKLYSSYDFDDKEYITILDICDLLEHKDMDKLIIFLREEGSKLENSLI